MKSILAITSIILAINSASAIEREFRIDHDRPIAEGYGIGWGIPGELIDFEKLEASRDEELYRFISNSGGVVNYVVDVETNKILKTVDSDMIDFSIGSYHVGNHYNVYVSPIAIRGLCENCESIAEIQSTKWSSGIESLDIIKREKGNVVITNSYSKFSIDEKLLKALESKIKGEKENYLFKNGSSDIGIEKIYHDDFGSVNKITYEFSIPKSEEGYLTIEAMVKMSLAKDEIAVEVISLKQKLE